jgi:hypothetical protein
MSTIPLVLIQGNNWSGVALCRRDNGLILFSHGTTPIPTNGEGDHVSGLRGGIVREGNSSNFWLFLENIDGTTPLHMTRIVVTPPALHSSPATPSFDLDLFPKLPGLSWELPIKDEFRTLVQTSAAPGSETRLSLGADPVIHFDLRYNFLREKNYELAREVAAVLTQISGMSVSVEFVDLSIANYADRSPRWAPDSTVIFAAGTSIYKLDPVLGTAAALFTAPDGNNLSLSNVDNGHVLAYTFAHIYELDASTLALVNTRAAAGFGLLTFGQCAYEQSSSTAWSISLRSGHGGGDVYQLDLGAVTYTQMTFTDNYVNYRMILNQVVRCLGLLSGATIRTIALSGGAIATGTLPANSTGALAVDDDGFFWTSDGFASDVGTPSWKIDPVSLAVVLTVGTYQGFAFAPDGTPRAQDYGFSNLVPTVDGPLTYQYSGNELWILRSFFRAHNGGFKSFLLSLPDLTENPADGTVIAQPLTPDANNIAPLVVSRASDDETIFEAAGVTGNPGTAPVIKKDGAALAIGTDYNIVGPGFQLAGVTYPGLAIQFLTSTAGHAMTADFSWYYRVRFEQSEQEFDKFLQFLYSAQRVQLVTTRNKQ